MSEVCFQEARYTDKAHHDLVIKNLAHNTELVLKVVWLIILKYIQEKKNFITAKLIRISIILSLITN